MKKVIAGLTVLLIGLTLVNVLPAKAAAPTGTLTGTVITVDIGQILAINAITVTDVGVPEITAANDICIRINGTTNANWDVADTTTAAHGGTAAAKASTTVSYPGAKILRINVTANFLAGETLIISGLSYVGHTAATGGAVLQWSIDNCAIYGDGNANTAITVADGAEDTLTTVTDAPASALGGLADNHTVAFTVPATGVIPANGKILVTFPAGFNVAGATAGALTNIDGTVALSVAGQVVTLTRQNDGTNSLAGAKSVIINNVINPTGGGGFNLTVRTDTSADQLLATANSAEFYIHPAGSGPPSGGSSDSTPPVSKITEPSEGTEITAGKPYTIKGKAIDYGGSLVLRIEVSLDDGKSWKKTEIKSILANEFFWEYVWENPTVGNYTIKSRATDQVGNIEEKGAEVTVTVTATAIAPTPETPAPVEKPITEMTVQELEAKILEIQQKIIDLLTQLIQLIQQQIQQIQ